MIKRINVDDLPEFDAARYLDSEEAIAAYLTDISEQRCGLIGSNAGRNYMYSWNDWLCEQNNGTGQCGDR